MRISDWSSDVCSSDLFDSELTLPEWQLEPDNEAYFGEPDNGMYVDENGMPLESEPGTETDMPAEPAEQTPETTTSLRLDQKWIDGVLRRETSRRHTRSGLQPTTPAAQVPTQLMSSPLPRYEQSGVGKEQAPSCEYHGYPGK